MIVASFGGGVNSTAMLIGKVERKEPVDLILFADTGGEKPHTYEHVERFSKWLKSVGYPEITMVARHTTISKFERIGEYTTLEEDCLAKNMLPSIVYGFKACSQKYKREPQDKFCNSNRLCLAEWAVGRKVTKLIGYDADESHRANIAGDAKYLYVYPLIEWNWGREECVNAIKRAAQRVPEKSACFFCPSSKKWEILRLNQQYPDLAERAIAMEAKAASVPRPCPECKGIAGDTACPECGGSGVARKTVKGLGRDFSWAELIAFDKAQIKMFVKDSPIAIECGCYDGEAEQDVEAV